MRSQLWIPEIVRPPGPVIDGALRRFYREEQRRERARWRGVYDPRLPGLLPWQVAAPTLSAASTSNIGGTPRTTGSVSWNSGDVVLVLGMTGDNTVQLATPTTTGSGLTFSALSGTPTNTASSCKGYGWSATASATSSGTISSVVTGSPAFILVLVYSGSDGIGAVSVSATLGTTTTQNLTRTQANSAVACIWGDWNAVNDTTVTWTPSGQTQQEAEFSSGNFTGFAATWPDQGATGTTAYGFSGFAGGDMTAITVEVLGTAGGGGGTPPRSSNLTTLGVH